MRNKPSVVEIMMENASCNMKCKYCFGEFIENHNCHTNEIPEFNEDILNNCFKDVDSDYSGTVKLWGGEPLLHFETLEKMAKYVNTKFPKALKIVLTNGILLDENKANTLIKYDIHVTISHDGCGQSSRGLDPLKNKHTINAIKLLEEHGLFGGFHIVIHRDSDNLKKQFEYWEGIYDKLGFPIKISGSPINITDEWTEEFKLNNDNYNEWIKYELDMITGRSNENEKVKLSLGQEVEYSLFYYVLNHKNKYLCASLDSKSFGLSGKQYRCVLDCERRSGTDNDKLFVEEDFKLMDECKSCDILPACNGQCLIITDEQRRKNCDHFKSAMRFTKNYIDSTDGLRADLFDVISKSGKFQIYDLDELNIEEV